MGENDNTIVWYENDGTGNFTEQPLADPQPYAQGLIKIADINGDGNLDIAVSNLIPTVGDPINHIVWYENDGSASPSFTGHNIDVLEDQSGINGFNIADLDGDGDPDIVAPEGGLDQSGELPESYNILTWYENDGDQNFTKHNISNTYSGFSSGVLTGDVNQDGDLDIIYGKSEPGETDVLLWFENDGAADPSFAEHSILTDSKFYLLKDIADINGDENLDFLVINDSENAVFWYENDGSATPGFIEHTIADLMGNMLGLSVADFNSNGYQDVIFSSKEDSTIFWYQNTFIQQTEGRSVFINESGSGEFIKADAVGEEFSGEVDFTTEFWLKTNKDDQPPEQKSLFGIHTSSGSNGIIIFMTTDGFPVIYRGTFQPVEKVQIGDDKWHHIAVVQDTDDEEIRLYVDGKFVQAIETLLKLNPDYLWSFGQEYDSGPNASDFTRGVFDELRVWKTARTQQELRQTMFQTVEEGHIDLAGYWPLDENSGNVAEDFSGRGNTATLVGGPSRSTDTHPYGTWITGSEGWRMMSSPVDTSYGAVLEKLWTQGFPGADAEDGTSNIYTWDEANQEFSSISDAKDIPTSGTGFITYVYDDQDFDGSADGFPKMITIDSTQNTGPVSPTLTYNTGGCPRQRRLESGRQPLRGHHRLG